MAAAVCEAIDSGPTPGARSMSPSCPASPRCWPWRRGSARRSVTTLRLSLSDNLKAVELIERRLDAAPRRLRVRALQSGVSRARPWQLGAAFERLRRHLPAANAVVFEGRAVGRSDEDITVTELAAADRRPPTWQRWSSWARPKPAC